MFIITQILKYTHVQYMYVAYVCVFVHLCLLHIVTPLSNMHAPADYKLRCYDPPNKCQSHTE